MKQSHFFNLVLILFVGAGTIAIATLFYFGIFRPTYSETEKSIGRSLNASEQYLTRIP